MYALLACLDTLADSDTLADMRTICRLLVHLQSKVRDGLFSYFYHIKILCIYDD